jgi:hypothetical protein
MPHSPSIGNPCPQHCRTVRRAILLGELEPILSSTCHKRDAPAVRNSDDGASARICNTGLPRHVFDGAPTRPIPSSALEPDPINHGIELRPAAFPYFPLRRREFFAQGPMRPTPSFLRDRLSES